MVNMKTKINMAGPLIRVLTIISIVVLSASLVSAAETAGTAPPNKFSGTVTLNDMPAPPGTEITVYVGGVEQDSVVITTEGAYVQLGVIGSEGDAITFEVDGVSEDHTGVIWHEYAGPRILDLTTTGTPVAYVDSSSSGGGTYPTDVDTGEETSDGANTSLVSEDVVTSDAPSPTATPTATDESGAESDEGTGNGFPWIALIIVGLAVVAIILYLSRK
ncbi:MAG: hypothetical protein U9N43_00530 [Euryarchaeota archaeon]|nr:hypothetical protein [Euryarchaeota archaeon]